MKKRGLPLSKPLFTVIMLVTAAVSAGWSAALGHYRLCVLCAIVALLFAVKLVNVYRGIVRKLDFIFTAVRNGDFSYRFVENSKRAGYSVINHSLNRIKEVLDETKTQGCRKGEIFRDHYGVCQCGYYGCT